MSERPTDAEIAEAIEDVIRAYQGKTVLFPARFLDLPKRLRAAEQPPTPPSGRGEEREGIAELHEKMHALAQKPDLTREESLIGLDRIKQTLVVMEEGIAARDAVIAGLVKALELTINESTCYCEDTMVVPKGSKCSTCVSVAALATARPFTKETR